MIASETWRIYKANATWLFLTGLVAEGLQAGLTLLFSSHANEGWPGVGLAGFSLESANLLRLPRPGVGLLGVGLLYVILSLLVGVFTTSGVLHTVVLAQRGRLRGVGAFWTGGISHWGRMLRYLVLSVLLGLGIGLLATLLTLILPWLGFTLIVLAGGLLGVAYWYGSYALVAEQLEASDAFGRIFRILGNRLSDVAWTLLMLLVAGTALGLVSGILTRIPGLGWVLNWLLHAGVGPLLMLYVGVRYATNIAPVINPPGGSGSFHSSPPPGP